MVALLWPYLKVTQTYGLTRSYADIEPMLPTWRTYLQSDYSWLWGGLLAKVPHPPMSWEHQFFPGLAVVLLVVIGAVLPLRGRAGGAPNPIRTTAIAMTAALLALVVLTWTVRGHSLWFFVSQAPLFSAIRAVARISIVMLIPAGYLAGAAVELLWRRRRRWITCGILGALLVEAVAVTPVSSSVAEWRLSDRAVTKVPAGLPPDSVLFFAQEAGGDWWHDEVTAMWAARESNLRTMNGYSGGAPPGFTMTFGGDCAEGPTRVLTYLAFSGRPDDIRSYRSMMSRVVPIGFSSCQSSWATIPPTVTDTGPGPTPDQVAALRLALGSRTALVEPADPQVDVTVTNTGGEPVVAGGSQPVRLWFRYVDAAGVALTPWVGEGARLKYDLAPADVGTVTLPLDPQYVVAGGRVDVRLSTEGTQPPDAAADPTMTIPIR